MHVSFDAFYALMALTYGTLLTVPAYFLYRHARLIYRLIPTAIYLAVGFWAALNEAHGLTALSLGAVLYGATCLAALHQKAARSGKRLRDEIHFDWLTVPAFGVTYLVLSFLLDKSLP